MTDEELKQLVAGLAVKSDILDAQMKRTDEKLDKVSELFANIGRDQDERMKRSDERMKRNDERMKRTDEKLKKASELLGNIGRNQGEVAEEFFYNSLAEDIHLGAIRFDDIAKNEHKRRGKTEEEYDIVMTNGNAIGIVEVKYKVHQNDLQKLERKMRNFKKLFPVYEGYKLYGAIASFHINEDAKTEALERGFFVLQRSGKVIQTETAQNLLIL